MITISPCTQKEIAQKAGISATYMSNILSGRQLATEYEKRAIAKILNNAEFEDWLFGKSQDTFQGIPLKWDNPL